jgi:hypothetical protein
MMSGSPKLLKLRCIRLDSSGVLSESVGKLCSKTPIFSSDTTQSLGLQERAGPKSTFGRAFKHANGDCGQPYCMR